MVHDLFPSVAEMMDPATLSETLRFPITLVERRPLTAGYAHSGSGLELICTSGYAAKPGPALVLKRVSMEWDWLMRVTQDNYCRSVTLWTDGLLDRLPASCIPPVLSCARDGAGWAILMEDFSDSIMTNRFFTPEVHDRFVTVMAGMHAEFLSDARAEDPNTGLCSVEQVYRMFSPAVAQSELDRGDCGAIPARITEGWNVARRIMPSDVTELIDTLLDDPGPLVKALREFPVTLVHGDFRHSNLGVVARSDRYDLSKPRVALLDWQLAAWAPPAVELGRYLGANSPLLPETKEDCLRRYRQALTSALGYEPTWWERQLDLGMLGGFLQDGWAIALKATTWDVGSDHREHWKSDLEWWAERVRRGSQYL